MARTADERFQIGLAMSGAISAGAYTAGVFDFLVEALDQWEIAWSEDCARVARDGGAPRIPKPAIGLKVMSGASAGAITAAVGTVALADGNQAPRPYRAATISGGEADFSIYLPKLYETWVERPDLALYDDLAAAQGHPDRTDFLATIDLTGEPAERDDFARTSDVPRPVAGLPVPVAALLNWRLLDEIAKAAIENTAPRQPRPYVAEKLHVYLTLSNLRGLPYKIPFEGGNYHMISHGDRVHYQVHGLGTWNTESAFADHDTKREIATTGLGFSRSSDPAERKSWLDWKDFSVCALASAAFPVGLAPRDIGTLIDEYDGSRAAEAATGCYRRFPIESLHDGAQMGPDWPADVAKNRTYWFRTADGGIIDNDPFEYARFALKQNIDEPNPRDPGTADRAVVMISPFPEPRPIRPEGQPALDIASIFSALLPSLVDQARFKPSELVNAADERCASRYLIGPSRTLDVPVTEASSGGAPAPLASVSEEVEQRYGIASGLLGGFGGFVYREFRDHDFQLGRRNCQKFLKDAFALPASDQNIVGAWPEEAARDADLTTRGPAGETYHPIIPLFGTARSEVALRAWPQVDDARLTIVMRRIEQRFDAVAPKLVDENVRGFLSVLLRISIGNLSIRALDIVVRFIGLDLVRRRVLEFARLAILADLVRRNQIAAWDDLAGLPEASGLAADDIRAVLAEMIEPAYDQRTVAGLAKAMTALHSQAMTAPSVGAAVDPTNAETQVEALLAACMAAPDGARYKVWKAPWTDKAGKALYTLQSRAEQISWLDRRAIPCGIALAEALTRTPWKQIAGWLWVPNLGNVFPKPRTDPPGVP